MCKPSADTWKSALFFYSQHLPTFFLLMCKARFNRGTITENIGNSMPKKVAWTVFWTLVFIAPNDVDFQNTGSSSSRSLYFCPFDLDITFSVQCCTASQRLRRTLQDLYRWKDIEIHGFLYIYKQTFSFYHILFCRNQYCKSPGDLGEVLLYFLFF